MRFVIWSSVLVLSAAGLASIAIPASAQDRYCLQGREWGYPGNCEFSTYAQCRATASGTDSDCGINPRYGYRHQREDWHGPYRHD